MNNSLEIVSNFFSITGLTLTIFVLKWRNMIELLIFLLSAWTPTFESLSFVLSCTYWAHLLRPLAHESTQSHMIRLSLVIIHRNALFIRTIHTHTHTFSQTPSHIVFTFSVSNRAKQTDWDNASIPLAPSESSLMCAYIISTSSELDTARVKSLLSKRLTRRVRIKMSLSVKLSADTVLPSLWIKVEMRQWWAGQVGWVLLIWLWKWYSNVPLSWVNARPGLTTDMCRVT